MVMQTPFERLLQSVSEKAQTDPDTAFDDLDQLFNKSSTEDEVLKVCAFATNLGAAALGRVEDTVEFLKKLLTHPAVNFAESSTRRSIFRALTVLHICLGDEEAAKEHQGHGVTNASEHCRLSIMAANTLIARQQFNKAIPHLKRSAALCSEVADDDEIIKQVASVSFNVSKLAEKQLKIAKDVLLNSSYACKEAWLRDQDWHVQHKALYQYAKSLMKCGMPSKGLDIVQRMMKLERKNNAGPLEQFFSASIACRGQTIRGQVKIASQALAACEAFAEKVGPTHKAQVEKVLEDVRNKLHKEQDRVTRH